MALVDVVFKHGEEGSRFYWLVKQGRMIDDHINIYSIIDHHERELNKDFTVDAVLQRLEGVIVREYEKGGTAASIKSAVDRAFDEMQARTAPASQKAAEATGKAATSSRTSRRSFVGRRREISSLLRQAPIVIPGERERFTRARGKGTQALTPPRPSRKLPLRIVKVQMRKRLGPLPLATLPCRSAGDDNRGYFPRNPSSTFTVFSPSFSTL